MTNLLMKNEASTTGLIKRIKKTLSSKPATGNVSGGVPLIDHPLEGEKIQEGLYAIRISSESNSEVEISINNGDWQPCRSSVGYWWFDWQPLGTARCKMVARARFGKGRWKKSDARSCEIAGSSQPLSVGLTFD